MAGRQNSTTARGANPRAYRRHMLLPKPARRRPQLRYAGGLPQDAALVMAASRLAPADRAALREIVEGADLIEVDGRRYLLAPVSAATLDTLAAFEAELEDLEPEPDDDDDDTDTLDDSDFEPNDHDAPVPVYRSHEDQREVRRDSGWVKVA